MCWGEFLWFYLKMVHCVAHEVANEGALYTQARVKQTFGKSQRVSQSHILSNRLGQQQVRP